MVVASWVMLAASAAMTLLTFLCLKGISPLSRPGVVLSEGGILVLMLMFVRWLAIFLTGVFLLVACRGKWWGYAAWAGGQTVLGLISLSMFNRWVSVAFQKSPAEEWTLCIGFFVLPVVVMAGLAVAAIRA